MVNAEILDRLRLARTPKDKKPPPKPIARVTAPKKQGKRINGRSEKMRAIMKALGPLYKKYLSTRPDCAIVSPECTGEATAVHHVKGRGINQVMNEENWKPCCESCNGWVEQNDAQARAAGHKKSRLTK